MKRLLKLTIASGLIAVCAACSSSKTSSEGPDPNLPPAGDAATDAVPQANAENPPPPSDGNAPAGDAQAQAQNGAPPPPDAAGAPPADGSGGNANANGNNGGGSGDVASAPPSPPGSGQFDSYTVQEGDTLMKVAFETYGDLYRWKGIYEANKDKVSDPNHIPKGTVLKVEKPATPVTVERNGDKYLIQVGDTLGKISNHVYGTPSKWKTLWENNKQLIHNPNKIFAGFYLYYLKDGNTQPQTLGQGGAPAAGTPPQNVSSTTGDRAPASDPGASNPPPVNTGP